MIATDDKKRPGLQRIAERPKCPEHGDTMHAYSTYTRVTYYRCRECGATAKAVRVAVDR